MAFTLVVVGACLCTWAALSRYASAQDEPSASPVAEGEAKDTPAAAPVPAPGLSPVDLDKRLKTKPVAFGTMVVLRFGAIVAGLVLLILAWTRRRDARAGRGPPLRPSVPPPTPFTPVGGVSLFFATQVFAALGLDLLGHSGLPGTSPSLTWPWQFGLIGVVMVSCALVAGWALARARRREGRLAWPGRTAAALGVGGFAVAAAIAFPVSFLWVHLLDALGEPPRVQSLIVAAVAPGADPWFLAALLVLGVVVAPVTEELIYRGALYGSLRARVRPRVAAVVSSVLFAAVHQSWTAALPLLVLALVLCWVYERSGSLVAPVVVHAVNNAVSLVPLYLVHL